MAFYVSETTSTLAIAGRLKIDQPTLVYHTQVLVKVGAVEARGYLGHDPVYGATELGAMAYVNLTSSPEENGS